MQKTVISAAALALSTALAGFTYAAASDGPTPTEDTSVVSPASTSSSAGPSSRTTSGATTPTSIDAPDDSDGRVGGGHGADDSGSDDSDSGRHGSGGRGSHD